MNDRGKARAIPGTVYLVGAGPGDPGLITLRGAEVLGAADVVIHDHLVHPRLLDLAPPSAERIDAGKSAGHHTLPQPKINELLVEQAQLGRVVIRLKGGDPFVFGRGAEEAEHLHAAGVPCEVIPGVTAAVGATAYAGIPITHRDSASAVAFLTGHDPGTDRLDWRAIAAFPGTLVLYMGLIKLRALAQALMDAGKPAATPAALVASGSLAQQRVLVATLGEIADRAEAEGIRPPALVVLGEVVRRREALTWFESRPLLGRRIVLTRPSGESDDSSRRLEVLGAEAIPAPTVVIRPMEDFAALDDAIARLPSFDWLVFTSPNGVRHFLDRLRAIGRDLRALGHLKLAAIGPATAAALAESRLDADLVPPSYRSEDLAAALAPQASGQSILLARADRGRVVLQEELGKIARVEQVAVYRNADAEALPPGIAERIAEGSVDWITLTSSAIARRLRDLLPDDARAAIASGRVKLAALSPITAAAANELGWPIAAEAGEYTFDGLIAAIVEAEARATA